MAKELTDKAKEKSIVEEFDSRENCLMSKILSHDDADELEKAGKIKYKFSVLTYLASTSSIVTLNSVLNANNCDFVSVLDSEIVSSGVNTKVRCYDVLDRD